MKKLIGLLLLSILLIGSCFGQTKIDSLYNAVKKPFTKVAEFNTKNTELIQLYHDVDNIQFSINSINTMLAPLKCEIRLIDMDYCGLGENISILNREILEFNTKYEGKIIDSIKVPKLSMYKFKLTNK